MVKLAVYGATGRMGRTIINLIAKEKDLILVGAVERPDHPAIGEKISSLFQGEIPEEITLEGSLSTLQLEQVDVVVDFTTPQAALQCAQICQESKTALVSGTTGFDSKQQEKFENIVKSIPCVQASNFSLGTSILFWLTGEVTKRVDSQYETEIIEAHHHFKKDAPSGTAKRLAKIVADIRNKKSKEPSGEFQIKYGRAGQTGVRNQKEICIHSIRAGDIVGEHTVLFATEGERIELTHRASSREAFAKGALFTARWVKKKNPGFYDMFDVLGLK